MDKFTYILGGEIIEINSVINERLRSALRSFVQFLYVDTPEKQNPLKPAMRLKISESSNNVFYGNIIHSFDIEGGQVHLHDRWKSVSFFSNRSGRQ